MNNRCDQASKRAALMFLLMVLIGTPAVGQTDIPRVTLEEALSLFVRNNLELQLARSAAAEIAGLARQAAAHPNPSVSATYEPLFGQGSRQGEAYLTFSQRLERPGLRRARVAAAERVSVAAAARLQADSLRLAFDVIGAFIEAAAAEDRATYLQEVTGVFRKAEKTGLTRVSEGDLSGYELRRLRVERARYENALALAEIDAQNARRHLASLVMPDEAEVRAAHRVEVSAPTLELTEVLENARRLRPEVREAQAEIDAAQAEIDVARRERLPDLTATAGLKYQSDGMNGLYLGASVPLPLFDQNRGNIAARQARIDAARTRLALIEQQVETEVRRAYTLFASLARRVRLVNTELLAGAGDLLRIANVSYDEGEMSLVELLDAAEAYHDARLTTVDLQAAYWSAYFDLLHATGGTLAGTH